MEQIQQQQQQKKTARLTTHIKHSLNLWLRQLEDVWFAKSSFGLTVHQPIVLQNTVTGYHCHSPENGNRPFYTIKKVQNLGNKRR